MFLFLQKRAVIRAANNIKTELNKKDPLFSLLKPNFSSTLWF